MSKANWVEIVEPGSGRKVYANTNTGQCLWKPPKGVDYKPCSDDQWWELTDGGTGRCYYYNASTKKTVWERPKTGDIVSLSRLQEAQKEMMETDKLGDEKSQENEKKKEKEKPEQKQPQQELEREHDEQENQQIQEQQQRMQEQQQQQTQEQQQQQQQLQQQEQQRPLSVSGSMRTPPSIAPKPPKVQYNDVASNSPDLKNFKHNLNTHKKGLIFKRKVSLHNMLSWSPQVIPRPMLLTLSKEQKRQAIDMFKCIQQYMGDRSAKGKTKGSIGAGIIACCWDESNQRLRDEFYVQVCKQTTGNNKVDSCERGWELIAIGLSFFPPTMRFFQYLKGYIAKHTDSQQGDIGIIAETCYGRLERIHKTGRKQGAHSPSEEDIDIAVRKVHNPSVFGSSLEEVMAMQEESHPHLEIPLVLQTLSNAVLVHGGESTEGIFRVPGDIDGVNHLKLLMDKGESPSGINDPHVPASTLKLWFRELVDPIIPNEYYEECVKASGSAAQAVEVVNKLPPVNRSIVLFITRFLQNIGRPENQPLTKMTYDNLSMVWAPNFLRCPDDDPLVIFNNTKKEMSFMRQLVLHLDTESVAHLFLQ
eukprot:m.24065 g.24065  ORF g.24065 m.24065 type:complete len:589 (+) comp5612_c0_seq1:328-2094(+)